MSHHFDLIDPDETRDETPKASAIRAMDISDVFCFAGPSDDDGPRTVIGMNASPQDLTKVQGDTTEYPWDPGALYELKLDLNGDFVEDITWRFTFPTDPSTKKQYVQIAQLTGPDATSRTAPGTVITPPNAPVGQVLSLGHGIKAFADLRLDSFFTDIRVPAALRNVLSPTPPDDPDPHLDKLPDKTGFHNTFANQVVRLVMLELPARITGLNPIHCWGSTAIFDTTHTPHSWVQVQRAAGADVAVVFGGGIIGDGTTYHDIINSTGPSGDLAGRPANPATDPATGLWGAIRDEVAVVVKAMGTYNQGPLGQATPEGREAARLELREWQELQRTISRSLGDLRERIEGRQLTRPTLAQRPHLPSLPQLRRLNVNRADLEAFAGRLAATGRGFVRGQTGAGRGQDADAPEESQETPKDVAR